VSSPAQTADPPPPSPSDLARRVGEQARALEEQRREMGEGRGQKGGSSQLQVGTNFRFSGDTERMNTELGVQVGR